MASSHVALAQQNEEMEKRTVPHEVDCKIYEDEGGFYLDYSSEESCDLPSFQLPQGVSPKDVTRLKLENRNLTAFPAIIFKMPNLRMLDLRHNCLKSVPPEISKLQKLQVLKLAMNHITKLPHSICQMENLEVLHLGSNELRDLPENFDNLKLKQLWINDNYFKRFPIQITKITTLEKLDAHGNQMKTMPKAIRELSKVTSLDMHKNRLISIPRAIVSLLKSKLKYFVYHANRIGRHPKGFDQVISKANDSPPNFKDNQKSWGIKKKQTDRKSNKTATTTEAALMVKDEVVDSKTTKEQAPPVTSVPESSHLRVADKASENGQLVAAMDQECLHSPVVIHQNVYHYHGSFTKHETTTNNYYQSVNNDDTDAKDKSTMDTKDPLNDLIHFTADRASTGFKDIARKLDLSENDIAEVEQENRKIKECCIKALNMWRRKKGKNVTVEVLKKALIDSGYKDVADAFEDEYPGFQDVTTCDSGQVEEETCIMEAAGSSHNVESDRRRHSQRDPPASDQVQDSQTTTHPKGTLPGQPIEGGNRRCVLTYSNTSHHLETRAPNDNPRSLSSTCAQPTSIDSQPGRRDRQGNSTRSFNRQTNTRRAELNQDKAEGGGRHRSRPGPNSSAGHETGAPDRYRFPWNKRKPRV